jgi:hypothetical protein
VNTSGYCLTIGAAALINKIKYPFTIEAAGVVNTTGYCLTIGAAALINKIKYPFTIEAAGFRNKI